MQMICRVLSITALALGCSVAREAPRVQLPFVVGGVGGGSIETDLGYEVTLSEARLVVENFQFSIAGEAHSGVLRQISELLFRPAHAHPGHYQGGDVTGELPGRFALNLMDARAEVGWATLIEGEYSSMNFTFGHGRAEDGDDMLVGNTALLRGQATLSGEAFAFVAMLAAPEARQLIGVPFQAEVSESSQFDLSFELLLRDPLQGDTLFDGLPFAELPRAEAGVIELGPESTDPALLAGYQRLRRTLLTHDHFRLIAGGAR